MNQSIDHFSNNEEHREIPRRRRCNASSLFSDLPDEIILQIINKLIDLKTLCFCYLVSRRFSSIVLQADAIYFAAHSLNPGILDKNTPSDIDPSTPLSLFRGESFRHALTFMTKFKGVKSLRIEFPFSNEMGIDNGCLFKWMVNFDSRVESFMFVSPDSIFDTDGFCLSGNGDEVISPSSKQKFDISFRCMKIVIAWHMMLLNLVKYLPMLETVSVTDSGRRGRLSLSGKKLGEVKEWLYSTSKTVFSRVEVPYEFSLGCLPVLELPVSRYVMKEVYVGVMKMKDVQGGNDDLMKSEDDGIEDKEEAAYTEAMMEILKKHSGIMDTYPDNVVL